MKTFVCLSGGMDSACLLPIVQQEQGTAVSFDYGSKHNEFEIPRAQNLAAHYGLPHVVIDLRAAMAFNHSHLMARGGEIPEGHYEAVSMKQTVVPGRNTIMAAFLMGMLEQALAPEEQGRIYMGIHRGDHAIYPDCRPEWLYAMSELVRTTVPGANLFAPFLTWTKAQIVQYGLDNKVPFELTRTCYKQQAMACGKCGSCQERLEAFHLCNVKDPLQYESRELLPK